ncbi:xanthine dehydrogenase small subunit [Rhodospirillum sp. A1_3_36]|uniref:xanthine dehydrogenase small subunit n=1 Tax=Rhodospirillum sp. A1_3_36 TaxID=3391666 RepID=UPI0039A699A9
MDGGTRFALNGQMTHVVGVPPDWTLLRWLRGEGWTASKEGCAEGDCGACTVLLGTPPLEGDGLTWRAINACLVLLPQIHGGAVITAEGLAGADGTAHPVQRALADFHGTQCGYCSPGFTMALAALSLDADRSEEAILESIAGNLCRCTGYRPIVEAARTLPNWTPSLAPAVEESLRALAAEPLAYTAEGQRVCAPVDLAEALAFRAEHPDAWVWAGGTDLGLRITKSLERPTEILALGRIPALRGLRETEDSLEIGATTPYAEALAAMTTLAPSLGALVRRIAAAQIRNLGTLAGNLGTASPIGDSLPPLIALGAEVILGSTRGERVLPVEDFVTGYRKTALAPDELILSIRISKPSPDLHVSCHKVAKRVDQDISAVSAAFVLGIENGCVTTARLAYGGVADRPKRAVAAEEALLGQPWTRASLEAAKVALAEDIAPMDDARGTAAYRRLVAANLLERLYLDTTETSAPLRLEAL